MGLKVPIGVRKPEIQKQLENLAAARGVKGNANGQSCQSCCDLPYC